MIFAKAYNVTVLQPREKKGKSKIVCVFRTGKKQINDKGKLVYYYDDFHGEFIADAFEKAKIKDEADEVIKKFKDNIGYDIIKNDRIYNASNSNLLEEFVEIIKTALNSKNVRVNRQEIPSKVFADRILKLNQFHIEYVVECISNLKTKIRNIPAYLLTSIYNSYTTIDMYYDNLLLYS